MQRHGRVSLAKVATLAGLAVFAGCGSSGHASAGSARCPAAGPSNPVIGVAPGLVTLTQGRTPAGLPFSITAQRICFETHVSLCLRAQTQTRPAASRQRGVASQDSAQICPQLPLPQRHLVLSSLGQCVPRRFELIYGLVLDKRLSVLLQAPGGLRLVSRAGVPSALRVRGDVFYAFVTGTPASLLVRSTQGTTVEARPISATAVPYGCRARR